MQTIEMTAVIQYILTTAESFEKSRMTILEIAGVLLCENEQA